MPGLRFLELADPEQPPARFGLDEISFFSKHFAPIARAMSEASDPLYKKALLRLAADAAGAGRLAKADATATAANPACGDRVTMEVALDDGKITALAHDTNGCILTQASAAILGREAPGLDQAALEALEAGVRAMLKDGAIPPLPAYEAFDGVAVHPGRHTCVLLPLTALLQALEQRPEKV
jgi:NifU-like protein involved in Fe-S cluster formation